MFNFLKNIYNSIAGGAGPQIEAPSCSKSRHISSDETENRVCWIWLKVQENKQVKIIFIILIMI